MAQTTTISKNNLKKKQNSSNFPRISKLPVLGIPARNLAGISSVALQTNAGQPGIELHNFLGGDNKVVLGHSSIIKLAVSTRI